MWSQISKEFLTWADIKSELMVYTQPYSHYSIYRRDSIVYVANFPFLLAIRICLLSRQSPLSTLAAPYRANWEAEEGRHSGRVGILCAANFSRILHRGLFLGDWKLGNFFLNTSRIKERRKINTWLTDYSSRPRTAIELDGKLNNDLWKSETSREIKKII